MKFKFNKFKGFTLSELMIMLAVLTVLLAAFAPVFTARYKNASANEIWSFVPDDDEDDAYTDQVNHAIAGQIFIGITPVSGADVLKAIKDNQTTTGKTLYSKVVIRPTENLSGLSDKRQKQFQFQYENQKAALFAGTNNILLGGQYLNIESDATDNTAFGVGALSSLSRGDQNTALGNNSLNSLTSANYNTAIGAYSGVRYGSNSNTMVGYNSFSSGNNVTAIGNSNSYNSRGDYSTIVGHSSAYNIGQYNTVLGNASANNVASYNTVVGSNALKLSAGGYNTAIGYGACSGVTGSNKTCVGYNSGSIDRASNINLFSGNEERIFIGGPVNQDEHSLSGDLGKLGSLGGVSVLEIHNVDGTTARWGKTSKSRIVGNSSVVVNGNLIVRGQFYMNTVTSRMSNYSPLVAFREQKPKSFIQSAHVFSGYDGQERNYTTRTHCRGKCRVHKYDAGAKSCTCSKGTPSYNDAGVVSYDWSSNTLQNGSKVKPHECMEGPQVGTYYDRSLNIEITGGPNGDNPTDDVNEAHTWSGESCCPKLLSDIRLKNVGTPFTAGLEEIKNLNIYNYTYKSDSAKMPHVGVVAQDLKLVFPTAVSKDENGYYQIRWDEIFYAAINAVKSLNSRVEALANRVANDQKRIATLKRDNAQLEQKINSLSAELTELEKKNK